MLQRNTLYQSINECFADAPEDVRSAVNAELFSRREHVPTSVADLYAGLVTAHGLKIAEYLQQLGMEVDVSKYAVPRALSVVDNRPQ